MYENNLTTSQLLEKWEPLLEHSDLPPIPQRNLRHRKAVTACLLENQEIHNASGRGAGLLTEASINVTGDTGFSNAAANAGPSAGFDPILVSMVRRTMPNLIAYDLVGTIPMRGPYGAIFAKRARYVDGDLDMAGPEAFYNEADPTFSGGFGTYTGTGTNAEQNPGLLNDATGGGTTAGAMDPVLASSTAFQANRNGLTGANMATSKLEVLGSTNNEFREMANTFEKVTVHAGGRGLRASWSIEMAQDLKAIHGIDAEAELTNDLATQIITDINRELVRVIYHTAKPGAQNNVANAGVYDLNIDSNGRWSKERMQGMLFQLHRDASAIAQQTRRGRGNIVICSADVASAFRIAGILDYAPEYSANLDIDDTDDLFAGTIDKGRSSFRVFIDPYSANSSNTQYFVVGYKGRDFGDCGLYYCPYIGLQLMSVKDPATFQPSIGFKTRYGLVASPFAEGATAGGGRITFGTNTFYRRVRIANLN